LCNLKKKLEPWYRKMKSVSFYTLRGKAGDQKPPWSEEVFKTPGQRKERGVQGGGRGKGGMCGITSVEHGGNKRKKI